MRKYLLWLLAFLLVVSSLILYEKMNFVEPLAEGGMIDLEAASAKQGRIIPLNGQWEFYWGQLLESQDFKKKVEVPSYMTVPGNWRKDSDGKKYYKYGYATYRLVIKNARPNYIYGIKKQSIRIACKIFINGKLLIQDGEVSDSISGEVMGNTPQLVFFQTDSREIEMIVQVASHKIFGGGIANAIYFGGQQELTASFARNMIQEVLPIAFGLGVAGIYLIIVLLIPGYYKKERASIFFPTGAASLALMNATIGEKAMKYFLPGLSTETLLGIESVVIAISFISIVLAVYWMENTFIPVCMKNNILRIQGLFILLYLILPSQTPGFRMIFTVIDFLLLFIVEYRVFYLYIKDSHLQISRVEHGLLLLVLFFADIYFIDLFVFTEVSANGGRLMRISSVLYVLVWLLLLIFRYHSTFKKSEKLTEALLESHYNLEKISGYAKRSEIAFLQAQIKPHFLFNSLSSILSLCHTNPDRATELLRHLSEFLKSAFVIDMSSEFIRVESELESIRSYVFIEKTRFGERLEVDMEIDDSLKTLRIVPLLIEPLVENAIRHGALKREEGGRVRLALQRDGDFAVVAVYDNGFGFSADAKKELETKLEGTEGGRRGVGIRNIKERLGHYYGEELRIEEQKEGVKVWFRIPLEEGGGGVESSHC